MLKNDAKIQKLCLYGLHGYLLTITCIMLHQSKYLFFLIFFNLRNVRVMSKQR